LRAIQEKDNQISRTSAALEDEEQRVSQITYADVKDKFVLLETNFHKEIDKLKELTESNDRKRIYSLMAEGKITKPREAAGFASRAQPAGLHRGTLPSSRANLKAS